MGARKRNRAEQLKEVRKNRCRAVLRNCPTSPRKMRLVADLIRGYEVNRALDLLKFSKQQSSQWLEKLLLSAISNWQQKNEGAKVEESGLFVKEIYVNAGRTLKRLQTAPQGRAYRIRKRSNHVTVVLGSRIEQETEVEVENISK
ncbi:MAG: 50S ribosomal protein L22 [Bacteroidales bacterium]